MHHNLSDHQNSDQKDDTLFLKPFFHQVSANLTVIPIQPQSDSYNHKVNQTNLYHHYV